MQFVFNGTLEEFKKTLQTRAKEYGKDIIVYHNEPNTLEIGFQRLSHSGGRFFIANITETENNLVLSGELVDVYSDGPQTKLKTFWSNLGAFALFYVLIEMILQIIWLPIFHFAHIWLPLLLPLPFLIFCKMNVIKEEKETDAEFIAFMSAFTSKYCSYLKEYIGEGCCYDLQMILGGYIKTSALPEVKIDKTELCEHCSSCKYR